MHNSISTHLYLRTRREVLSTLWGCSGSGRAGGTVASPGLAWASTSILPGRPSSTRRRTIFSFSRRTSDGDQWWRKTFPGAVSSGGLRETWSGILRRIDTAKLIAVGSKASIWTNMFLAIRLEFLSGMLISVRETLLRSIRYNTE